MKVKFFKEETPMGHTSKLMILGASGHGKVAADIALLNGYESIVFLDDDTSKKTNGSYPVVGTITEFISKMQAHGSSNIDFDVFVAIGNNSVRMKITEKLTIKAATLIHPAAVIDRTAVIHSGSIVMAGAIVNADAFIGRGCIINTGASIDHDCILGDYVHISPGAHIAGTVNIGSKTWFGIGSCCVNNVDIAPDCIVGAGAAVIDDIDESGTYVGCPAVKVE